MYSKWPVINEPNGIHCALLYHHILISLCHICRKFPTHTCWEKSNYIEYSTHFNIIYNITFYHSVLLCCSLTYLIILYHLIEKFPSVIHWEISQYLYYVISFQFIRIFPSIVYWEISY